MLQWLRRLWHFNDEHCSGDDIAITEERKRRLTELMKLNDIAGRASPSHAVSGGHTDLQKAAR